MTVETTCMGLADGLPMDTVVVRRDHLSSLNSRPKLPLVIVVHDVLGFTDDTLRIAKRLANDGEPMVVAAPDLFQGLGRKPVCVIKAMQSLKRREGVIFDRLQAVQESLSRCDDVDDARVAVIGFCLGGGFALMYAAQAAVSVVAPFYGDVPDDVNELKAICPVVAGFGARDKLFAPQGKRLEQHLKQLGVPHDVQIYPDAGHAYMNHLPGWARLGRYTPMATAYHEGAAEDSWERVFKFFKQHL